jgi:beta-phosphoglucomutase-like phosphatase (HAD superfamily)
MIKPVEPVMFDCDGVPVDSEHIAARVQALLGAELGWPLAADRGRGRGPVHRTLARRHP